MFEGISEEWRALFLKQTSDSKFFTEMVRDLLAKLKDQGQLSEDLSVLCDVISNQCVRELNGLLICIDALNSTLPVEDDDEWEEEDD